MKVKSLSPKTIHVLGDSHALAFKRKSVEVMEFGLVFSASVSYVRGIRPDTLVQDSQLNKEIVEYFVQQGIIAPDRQPVALTSQAAVILEQYATGAGCQKELVVFHIGEIYVRKYLAALQAHKQIDPQVIENDFQAVVEVYVRSVVAIGRSFDLMSMIHEICPPTSDDAKFMEINGFACSRDRRSLVYGIFNKALSDIAQKHSVIVCTSKDYLEDENGCLSSEYEFDGVHADPQYTVTSISRIAMNWLCTRSASYTLRYRRWAEFISEDGNDPKISQIGVTDPEKIMDQTQVDLLKGCLGDFQDHVCRRPLLDWAHAPIYAEHLDIHKMIHYGVIDQDGLKLLHDVLIGGAIGDSIRNHIGSRFAVINVRAVKSTAHNDGGTGQQSFHKDGCPPRIFRGLLYLVDVGEDDGPFEYMPMDGSPDPKQVVGPAGSFILFDADAVRHRATPPRSRDRLAIDFIIMSIPDGADEIINSADVGCIWPVDPYMFSLNERCYPPVKSNRWFYPALVAAVPREAQAS